MSYILHAFLQPEGATLVADEAAATQGRLAELRDAHAAALKRAAVVMSETASIAQEAIADRGRGK